jgi:hypothetical protein
MTRQEFCKWLTLRKELATVRIVESLPFMLQLTKQKIEAIDNAADNINMSDVLNYMGMCHASFEIVGYEYSIVMDISDLRAALITERKSIEWSTAELSRRSGVPGNVITAFESGRGDLKLDSFFNIVTALDADIIL